MMVKLLTLMMFMLVALTPADVHVGGAESASESQGSVLMHGIDTYLRA